MMLTPPPTRRSYKGLGGTISALHFGPQSEPIKLVFCHANGFNAQSYTQILSQLSVHSVALDLRGHGLSELPTSPENLPNWYVFRDDITQFCQNYIENSVILAGHSFGAVSAILSAPLLGKQMIGFVGFDPVIVPPLFARVTRYKRVRKRMKHKMPIAARAGRRRSEFESADAAFENYKGRGAFKAVNDDILKDYLKGGVIPHGSGVKLACDPAWEQAIFCAQSHKTFKALKTLPKSSRFIFAGKNSPTPRIIQKRVAKYLGQHAVVSQDTLAHLFPLHHPDKAAKALEAMIDKVFN